MSSDDSDFDCEYNWKSYVVVRAFANDKHDCIPSTWLVFDEECGGRSYQTTVTYKFPSRAKLGRGLKFKKTQRPEKDWPEFDGKMLLDTNSQAEALRYIKEANARQKKFEDEDGWVTSNESDSEEKNPPQQSGTKRKQSDQGNDKNIQAKSKKIAEELDKKLESEKNEAKKQLHTHCYNFYGEINDSYQKTMSTLDNAADYLLKIISTYKDNAAAKPSSPLPTNQQHGDATPNDSKLAQRLPEPGPGIRAPVPKEDKELVAEDKETLQGFLEIE